MPCEGVRLEEEIAYRRNKEAKMHDVPQCPL